MYFTVLYYFPFQTNSMEQIKKRSMYDDAIAADSSAKRQRNSEEQQSSGDVDDQVFSLFSIDDDAVEDLSKLLEMEMTAAPVKVKFIDNPYSTLEIFMSSSSFITINGNEESCGSSFSNSDSSVMASIDLSGVVVERSTGRLEGGAWEADAKEMDCDGKVKEMDGCDYQDDMIYDDEMLARFIGEEYFESW